MNIDNNDDIINHINTVHISSIIRRVLTRELRGGCGAGGYSGARGMTSRGEGNLLNYLINLQLI